MSNQRTSAGTAADSSTQPIVNSSADIEANPLLAACAMSNENINVSTSINYHYQEGIIKVVPGVYSIRILSK